MSDEPIIAPAPDPRKAYMPFAESICNMMSVFAQRHGLVVINPRRVEAIASGMAQSQLDGNTLAQAYGWGLQMRNWQGRCLNMACWTQRGGTIWVQLVNAYRLYMQYTPPEQRVRERQERPAVDVDGLLAANDLQQVDAPGDVVPGDAKLLALKLADSMRNRTVRAITEVDAETEQRRQAAEISAREKSC